MKPGGSLARGSVCLEDLASVCSGVQHMREWQGQIWGSLDSSVCG